MKHGREYIKERRNKSGRNAAGAMALLLAAALLSACGSGKTADAQAAAAENGQGSENEGEKLQVMASFYPMYDFAQKIGGDYVAVTDMVPAGTEPHDWEPAAKDIAGLENADVFVYSGAGLEYWAEDILQNIRNEDLVTVEAAEGIMLLTAEEEGAREEDDGHDHGSYDPHVWLDPMKAKEEMANIRDAFSEADPRMPRTMPRIMRPMPRSWTRWIQSTERHWKNAAKRRSWFPMRPSAISAAPMTLPRWALRG